MPDPTRVTEPPGQRPAVARTVAVSGVVAGLAQLVDRVTTAARP